MASRDVHADQDPSNGESRLHLYNIRVEMPGAVKGTQDSSTKAKNLDHLRRNLISTFHTDPLHPEVRVAVYAMDGNKFGGNRGLGKLVMVGKQEPHWIPNGRTDGIGVNILTGKLKE